MSHFSATWQEQFIFNVVCFVILDQYDELNFLYSVCLLKQQFTGRHATLLKLCFVTLDLHGKMNSFKWCLLIETAVHR
jgi:hypothetical protein